MLSLLVLLLFILAGTGSVLSAPTPLSSHSKDSTLQAVELTTISPESVDPPLSAIRDRQRLMILVSIEFALWNANFSSDSEAIEVCKQYVANLEAQSPYARGDCHIKYHCFGLDPNGFPVVMIFATCSCDKADGNILVQVFYVLLKYVFMACVKEYFIPLVKKILELLRRDALNRVANTE